MLTVWMTAMALAQQPIVVMGSGLVRSSSESAAELPSTGTWVATLGDCLEESNPGSFRVVDRVGPTETVRSTARRMEELRELGPAAVVLAFGASDSQEAGPDDSRLRRELEKLLAQIRETTPDTALYLVDRVGPRMSDSAEQAAADAYVTTWNAMLASVTASSTSVQHIEVWAEWPREDESRTPLMTADGTLSDQGHARVGAAVCAALTPKQ